MEVINAIREYLQAEEVHTGALFIKYMFAAIALLFLRSVITKIAYRKIQHKEALRGMLEFTINLVTTIVLIVTFVAFFGDVSFFSNTLFEVGGTSISLSVVILVIAIIFLSIQFSSLFKKYVLSFAYDKYDIETSLRFTFNSLFQYVVIVIAIFVSLATLGIDLSSFTIFAGVVGVGIGFGLQNIASNFISGIILLFERPIKVGDRVVIDNVFGDVLEIKIRATVVRTLDNEHMIIPNSFFLEEKVVNRSFGDTRLRLRIPFGVSYNSDPFQVREITLQVVKELSEKIPEILSEPAPLVLFMDYGNSSLDFSLLLWTQTPKNELKIKSEVRYALFQALKENKIEIPFPQRDLHIRTLGDASSGSDLSTAFSSLALDKEK